MTIDSWIPIVFLILAASAVVANLVLAARVKRAVSVAESQVLSSDATLEPSSGFWLMDASDSISVRSATEDQETSPELQRQSARFSAVSALTPPRS